MGLAPRSVGCPAIALAIATWAPMGSDLSVFLYRGASVMPACVTTPACQSALNEKRVIQSSVSSISWCNPWMPCQPESCAL